MHLDYVFAAANLRAEVYGIEQVRNRDTVAELVQQVKVSSLCTSLSFNPT